MWCSLALCLVEVLLTASSLFASCRRSKSQLRNYSSLPSSWELVCIRVLSLAHCSSTLCWRRFRLSLALGYHGSLSTLMTWCSSWTPKRGCLHWYQTCGKACHLAGKVWGREKEIHYSVWRPRLWQPSWPQAHRSSHEVAGMGTRLLHLRDGEHPCDAVWLYAW